MLYRTLFRILTGLQVLAVTPSAYAMTDTPACTDCPVLVSVAPGEFSKGTMPHDRGGSPDEFPRHDVTLSNAFSIGRTQVTRGQFDEFVQATGRQVENGCWALTHEGWRQDPTASWRAPGFAQTDDHPVVCVSLEDARAYLSWLSFSSPHAYRLPTEAEWELTARGTGAQPFWGI